MLITRVSTMNIAKCAYCGNIGLKIIQFLPNIFGNKYRICLKCNKIPFSADVDEEVISPEVLKDWAENLRNEE